MSLLQHAFLSVLDSDTPGACWSLHWIGPAGSPLILIQFPNRWNAIAVGGQLLVERPHNTAGQVRSQFYCDHTLALPISTRPVPMPNARCCSSLARRLAF